MLKIARIAYKLASSIGLAIITITTTAIVLPFYVIAVGLNEPISLRK